MKNIYVFIFFLSSFLGFSQSSSKMCDTITQCGCPYEWWYINGMKANITFTNAGYSRHLYPSRFNFSIPATATITGIELSFSYTVNAPANTLEDSVCSLMKYGIDFGANKYAQTGYYNTNSSIGFGNSADLWSTTWTPAEINMSNFGFDFRMRAHAAGTTFGITNGFLVTVYYLDLSGILESQTSGSALYASGKILFLKNISGSNNKVEIYDLLGKKVFESCVETDQESIDLSTLVNGVYNYKLFTGDKMISRKIYIE